jgi:hypothetical protein
VVSQVNVEIVRALVLPGDTELVQVVNDDAASSAQNDLAAPFVHPQSEIHVGVGMGEATKTYFGPEGFRAAFADWLAPFEEYYVAEVEIVDCGERVLRLTEHTGRLRGAASTVTLNAAEVWTFRAGKVVRLDTYPDHAEGRKAVGLKE